MNSNYMHLSVKFSTAIAVISIMLCFNCGPKPPAEPKRPNAPFNVKAVTGSGSATLYWQIDRDPKVPISGYNIYLSDKEGGEAELYNSGPYPGDTDGDATRESIEIPRLENGRRYYAFIRTVMPDGSLSPASGKVAMMPLAQGKITISQNHTTDRSGFSFAAERYTPARDFNNDIYIYATSEKSGLSSPSKLHSSLRKTRISLNDGPAELSQPLKKGQNYLLKTADDGYARLTLIDIRGVSPNIEAVFNYIYYPPGVEPR